MAWTWEIARPGALPFRVELHKLDDPTDVGRDQFGVKKSQSASPNLKRVAAVSCAEKWPPQSAEILYLPEYVNGNKQIHATGGRAASNCMFTPKTADFLVEERPASAATS